MKVDTLAQTILTTPRGMNVPSHFSYSACGKLLVFLDTPVAGSNGNNQQLQQYLACLDLETMEKRDLFRADGDAEENLSPEERSRRERMREYATGVTSYIWHNGVGKIYLPLQGALYALDPMQAAPEVETIIAKSSFPAEEEGNMIGFQVSTDGTYIGFVRNAQLYVCTKVNGKFDPPVLQSYGQEPGVEAITNGLASYVAQEELDRGEGFWLPPARGKLLAYERVNETRVSLVHIGNQAYRYPFTGEANPVSELCICDIAARGGGNQAAIPDVSPSRVVPLALMRKQTEEEEEVYLAKVEWFDETHLLLQLLNRKQTRLELQMVNCVDLSRELFIAEENCEAWINLQTSNCTLLPNKGKDGACRYIWSSERAGGYAQLFLYERAQLLREITPPHQQLGLGYCIDSILAVGEQYLYFMGNFTHAMERNVLALRWDEEDEVRILTHYGTAHAAVFSPEHESFVLTHSSASEPITVTLRSNPLIATPSSSAHMGIKRSKLLLDDDELGRIIHYKFNMDCDAGMARDALQVLSARFDFDKLPAYATAPPSKFSTVLKDGETVVHSQLFIPNAPAMARGKESGPFPCIVYIYGGPHVQRVCNNWQASVDLRCQALRKMGFLVLKCDARGSARRGLSFEAPLKHAMGTVELEDHIQVLEQLAQRGLVDLKRGVGIMGWSYGGYMSALAICKYPNVFRVAVAGAPVTFWEGYDTCYTERYMGMPEENRDGYLAASVMSHLQPLPPSNGEEPAASAAIPFGKLMLIHGLLDENVHFTHTAKLIERLTELNKPYDLVVLPQERHGPRNAASKAYIENRILHYFSAHL